MSDLVRIHGQCTKCRGYEFAVCLEIDQRLVCLRCLIRRVNNEAPEIILAAHAAHEKNHENRLINWDLRPSNGCSDCDAEILEAWLEIFVEATVKKGGQTV